MLVDPLLKKTYGAVSLIKKTSVSQSWNVAVNKAQRTPSLKFYKVPHNILISKPVKCGLKDIFIICRHSWPEKCIQRELISMDELSNVCCKGQFDVFQYLY